MKRILQILLLAASLPLAAGCALESGSGGDGQGSQGGTQTVGDGDEKTNGSTGNGVAVVAEPNKGPSATAPITQDPNGGDQGPQPEPWVPPLSIRTESASAGNGSGSNHK